MTNRLAEEDGKTSLAISVAKKIRDIPVVATTNAVLENMLRSMSLRSKPKRRKGGVADASKYVSDAASLAAASDSHEPPQ